MLITPQEVGGGSLELAILSQGAHSTMLEVDHIKNQTLSIQPD